MFYIENVIFSKSAVFYLSLINLFVCGGNYMIVSGWLKISGVDRGINWGICYLESRAAFIRNFI